MIQKVFCSLLVATAGLTVHVDEPSKELIGAWQVIELVYEGKALPKDKLDQGQATITADRITVRLPKVKDGLIELTYKLVPEGIDLLTAGDKPEFDPLLGIFELKHDMLRIAFNNTPQTGNRPETPKADKDVTYFVLKKSQK